MEELTEVITAAEFHPKECNLFVYSSSKGIIRLCDMRQSALCDTQAKGKSSFQLLILTDFQNQKPRYMAKKKHNLVWIYLTKI
jgi:hypothetical protein